MGKDKQGKKLLSQECIILKNYQRYLDNFLSGTWQKATSKHKSLNLGLRLRLLKFERQKICLDDFPHL